MDAVVLDNQMIVSVEDYSLMKDLKRAISMMRGVTKVSIPHRRKLYSAYDLSMRDLKEGRVYEYESLDDLIKEIEG